MKILIRIFGVTIVGLIVSLGILYLTNTNTIINELNDASSLAMKQTQNKMMDKIIKEYDFVDNNIFSDIDYDDYYKKCFFDTVNDKDLYEVNVEADVNKGIIYAEISVPAYRLIPIKRLLNIVDISGENLKDIDSYRYEISNTITKVKPTLQEKDFSARAIFSHPENPDGEIRNYSNYKFVVYASNGNSTAASTIAGPLVEVRCTDKDDKVTVIQSAEGGALSNTTLTNKSNCDCKLFEVVVPEGVVASRYPIRLDTLNMSYQSTVTVKENIKKPKADFNVLDYLDIKTRYIDDLDKLDTTSIWLNDNSYKETLIEYIGKLK